MLNPGPVNASGTGWTLLHGNAVDRLRDLHADSIQTIITSPPYFGLRDYKVAGQIGLEPTLDEYVARLVAVFREAKRVLKPDGTLWLNLGDCHCSQGGKCQYGSSDGAVRRGGAPGPRIQVDGLKPKDLIGLPWLVAFALRADGWWLRSDIIWSKPNPIPESIRDRPTRAHEYIFLMSKRARYYYDADAIAERAVESTMQRISQPTFDQQHGGPKDSGEGNRSYRKAMENLRKRVPAGWHQGTRPALPGHESNVRSHGLSGGAYDPPGQSPHGNARNRDQRREGGEPKQDGHGRRHAGFNERSDGSEEQGSSPLTRNARTVWTIPTQPFPEAHFATFPEELARRCVVTGSRPGDTVLDPFAGSGTTGVVALANGRGFIGIELNPDYVKMAVRRMSGQPFQRQLC